ncbi:pyridoxamine 5'-phosphate oxidase family protein [Lysobacter niastensis]|uniref:Pyridoxamine 5'-phosphate oxidase family protein n=1 Tax=Lysobacter niastensis TaxID=380629 RepID=A0ABS0B8V2_9GAMM|nr:pyridoxamine 5'-phosphate oxidase family protein [Lysobacter niastensis]MBF6025415.1 pyridoxamine 5'-phosphate oxidase family protein [Lysobacter niastensis]
MPTEHPPSPWHRGEREIHDRLGVSERMEVIGPKVIRDFMPDQHRELFTKLPDIFVGAVDGDGQPWASIVEGEPGFIRSPDAAHLAVGGLPDIGDPMGTLLVAGTPIGMLGLEFHTRRRNRMNGHVVAVDRTGFSVEVEQSYGNCPQYIQTREAVSSLREPTPAGAVEALDVLDAEAAALIAAADTFFVATYADPDALGRQVDMSHRGGRAGFVRVEGNLLTIPDFSGNRFFNTLGNILATGRAGLLFIDFRRGDVLQVTGAASIDFDSDRINALQGAERLWSVRVEHAIRRRGALRRRLMFKEYSPNSLMTGLWGPVPHTHQRA